MAVTQKVIRELLQKGIPKQQWKLYSTLFEETAAGFISTSPARLRTLPAADPSVAVELVKYLVRRVHADIESIHDIRTLATDFNKRIMKAATKEQENEYILALAADLGASSSDLRKDRKALSRWLEKDTVLERCTRRIGICEYRIVFYLTCLAVVARQALKANYSDHDIRNVWEQLKLEKLLETILAYVGDDRLRVAIFRCLADTLRVLPASVRTTSVKDSTLNYIYRSALEIRQHVWIQVEALRLLGVLSDQALEKALHIRLNAEQGPDDIFVRTKAVQLIGQYMEKHEQLLELLPLIIRDPSPYVRQAAPPVLGKALEFLPSGEKRSATLALLEQLAHTDERQEVRASALLILPEMMIRNDLGPAMTGLLRQVFENERNSFVLRTGLKTVRDILTNIKPMNQARAEFFFLKILPCLEEVHRNCDDLAIRRWTAQAINFGEVLLDVDMHKLYRKLEKRIDTIKLGEHIHLPKVWFSQLDDTRIGRVLAQLAEEKGGLTLEKRRMRVRITKGDRFDFRFWRFLYEMLRPSPDKRQAHNHTIGRVFSGNLQAPTPIMAELTQTKVPGEPLLQSAEFGWRPYLPLVDQLFSLLSGIRKHPALQIYTAEGITSIQPPASWLQRRRASLRLTFRFTRYSQLRNWQEKGADNPSSYIRKLEKLGFSILFTPYGRDKEEQERRSDPAVTRFFSIFAIFLDPNLPGRIREYIFSVYENSLYELGIFAITLSLLFFGLRLSASFAVNKARSRIPLVVGGWGTRGKSGVERLKAALFESLGHGMLSKSTGCEAMFLHVDHFGKTQEMFLFRPYDKATIWEHHNLILLAEKMNCSIFLWECMGLTPAYVEILQHSWSRDDVSTITNTYPDHEDIQGPAGYDIPVVMTCFIPVKGTVITTEEQMLPILSEDATIKKTEFQQLGWLEAGLLTPDILQRFPYEEHPYNIALVAALAERLGIPRELALKEMADRVIPDIGVLKAFPVASIEGRRLEFVNGMSANERFATLSNWQRMGFETSAEGPDPEVYLITLINNRADRISRSQMFGSILARDVSADKIVLIGSNLSGMKGYIKNAWEGYLTENTVKLEESKDPGEFVEFLEDMVTQLRIPKTEEFLRLRFGHMLLPDLKQTEVDQILTTFEDPEKLFKNIEQRKLPQAAGVIRHMREHLQSFTEYHQFKSKLLADSQVGPNLFEELQELLTSWFTRRIFVVEDYHATGDQVISHLCTETPPGLLGRIMGMQNIKGTGLDFVYRWQAWERCWSGCNKLRDEDETIFEDGLSEMMAFQDYGLLCKDYVKESVALVNLLPHSQTERSQAGLNLVWANLDKKLEQVRSKMSAEKQESAGKAAEIGAHIIDAIEAFLDAGDAVRRRKKANLIYKDLANERISHPRAALELQALNKRQKGGWLTAIFKR
jgi:poly-gamma-glutamate synthase PgsB/CapB